MNKRTRLLAVATVVMVCLSGCSLAKSDLQDARSGDKLIGAFATCDEDLKDYDMQEGDTLHYQEKKLVRADGTVKKLTDEEIKGFDEGFTIEGTKKKDGTYNFNGIKGEMVLFVGQMEKDEYGESFFAKSVFTSENVYNVESKLSINEFEENGKKKTETENKIAATLGIIAGKEIKIRVNRIFQRSDGSVYVRIPDSQIMAVNADGSGGSLSVSESYQTNVSGTGISSKNEKEQNIFTFSFEGMDFLQNAQIRQMDGAHNLIKLSEVNFSKSESSLVLEEETEYVMIEESFKSIKGDEYKKRYVYDFSKKEADSDVEQLHTLKRLDAEDIVNIQNLTFKR